MPAALQRAAQLLHTAQRGYSQGNETGLQHKKTALGGTVWLASGLVNCCFATAARPPPNSPTAVVALARMLHSLMS